MDTLHVGHLEARYHLPGGDPAQGSRLRSLLRRVLSDRLSEALRQSGVPVEEEICIRHLHATVELTLDAGDDALADRWARMLAANVAAHLADAPAGDVVRYRSRHHAIADVVRCVLSGRRDRAWAWRQLGLFDEHAPVARLGELLRAEPGAAVGVLADLARAGRLPALLARLEPEVLESIALSVAAARAPAGAVRLEQRLRAARAAAPLPSETAAPAPAASRARRALRSSAIGRALRPVVRGDARYAAAAALLVLLEADPAAVLEPELLEASWSVVEEALVAQVPAQRGADAASDAEDRDVPSARVRGHEHEDAEPAAAEVVEPPVDDPEDVRSRGRTALGGLPFLLHVVQALELPLRAASELPARPLIWALHRLALALAGAEDDDPAALAFAGLPPSAEPPAGEPMAEDELAVLTEYRHRITGALRELLAAEDDEGDAALLERVCRRSATVVADPGWIEIHLSLDDASVGLRRAGLDLDPGFLPWLGVVVRFVYG